MSKELLDILSQIPTAAHSAYIEDSELRDMALAWAVVIRNESDSVDTRTQLAKYRKLIEDMDPILSTRFTAFIINSMEGDGSAYREWSTTAERIRKTLLPK